MIGKVITGKSFGGCIRYVVLKHDATVLDAAGIRIQDVSQIINDFNLQRKFNPALGKAVGHIVLSWSVNDAAKLNDQVMVDLAKEYLYKMKIRDTQYLVVKHNDKEHPHLHIVYNRVDNNGKTVSDNFQKQRNVHVAKELTLEHGFYIAPGKQQVKRQALKGADKVKYELFDAIRLASKKVRSIDELINVLARNGITTHLKYKGDTNEVQGISFSKGDHKFKGSEIDRSLSYGKLLNAIKEQKLKPEKSLADQLRDAVENGSQNGFVSETQYNNQYEVSVQPDGWINSQFVDISIADDIDDEAIHGRNRHRKKQARMNTR